MHKIVDMEDCGGTGKVSTTRIARLLEKSSCLSDKKSQFSDELATGSVELRELIRHNERDWTQPIYLVYEKGLEIWVKNDPDNAKISNLQEILKGLDLNKEADDLVEAGEKHICPNCQVVVKTRVSLTKISLRYIILLLAIIATPILLIALYCDYIGKSANPTTSLSPPTTNLTTINMTTPIPPTTTAEYVEECTYPVFKFGPNQPYLTNDEPELVLEFETYTDLSPEATCGPRWYSLIFYNWACVTDTTNFQLHCPSSVTSLSIKGEILPPQLEALLNGFPNLMNLTLVDFKELCQSLEEIENVAPLVLKDTDIKFLKLIDMPVNCENGRRYLSWLINNAGDGYTMISMRREENVLDKYIQLSNL